MPRIYPRGTKLSDVPADFRGLTWREYEAHIRRAEAAGALKAQQPEAPVAPEIKPVPGLQRTIRKKAG